nr:MAG TPA: hypothetical protein [Caudoviricetes sp.]
MRIVPRETSKYRFATPVPTILLPSQMKKTML